MIFRFQHFLLFLFLSLGLQAQILSPVSWSSRLEPVEGDVFALQIVAKIDKGWAVYSQFTPDNGPIPTTVAWEVGDHYELIGKTTETGDKKEGIDPIFNAYVIKFLSKKELVFTQKVRVRKYGQPIKVALEFMCCDDEQCLPPTEETFSFLPKAPTNDTAPAEATAPKTTTTSQAPSSTTNQAANLSTTTAAQSGQNTSTVKQPESEPSAPSAQPLAPKPGATITATEPPATDADPVTWQLTATPLGERTYEISMEAIIEPGWSLYGKDLATEGPVANAFVLEEDGLRFLSPVREEAGKLKKEYEAVWKGEVIKIFERVRYTQTVELATNNQRIAGIMTYMACEEVCLPPQDIPFSVDVSTKTATIGEEDLIGFGALPSLNIGGSNDECATNFNNEPKGECSAAEAATIGQSQWKIFGLGFLGGLFAILMPCIFPMIPLTVNFFNKGGKSRREGIKNAGLYGLFIFLIYVLLSVPFHLIEGVSASILNDIASNVWVNVLFFAVFMFFAGSFFGYYELTVPESWSNRSSKAESTGGLAGIFFMALTLALVSFSCTGPILGSLLVGTASEGAWPLTAGMAGFGLAIALPFGLFAAFPQLLKSMPSSGGWLNSVKVVLGFAEVALALKFLSNADLVGHWNILKIEPFYLIWILCSLGIAAYLFGFISFPLDSKKRKIGWVGGLVAVSALVFAGYLASGFQKDTELGSYKPLRLLSGIAPAVCYSFINPCDCPQGIPCFKDLDEGMAYACKVDKPVILDFTGYSCANCRKMEENVWSQDRIRRVLSNDFVLISLYVDERAALPEAQHQTVERLDRPGATKKIDQVGEKWHYFQEKTYQINTQPYYVLTSPSGELLNPPVSYTPDVNTYEQFLQCGLTTYQTLMKGK